MVRWCCRVYICHMIVTQWITFCHKNCMATRLISLLRVRKTSVTMCVSTIRFHLEIMLIWMTVKSTFEGSCDKQNVTLVVL